MNNKKLNEILRNQYKAAVMDDLKRIDFKTDTMKRYIMFITTVIIPGLFFAMCSAGDTSYLPTILNKHPIIILIALAIYEIVSVIIIVRCFKNISKEHVIMKEFTDPFLKRKYGKYLLKILGVDCTKGKDFIINEIKQLMKSKKDQKISINEFETFLLHECEHWKLNVSPEFYKNLAKTIILTRVIDGTLIEDKEDYIFILENNEDLFLSNIDYII